jgi:two-component system, NarL family, nitrate/nitrite response regulator NarL
VARRVADFTPNRSRSNGSHGRRADSVVTERTASPYLRVRVAESSEIGRRGLSEMLRSIQFVSNVECTDSLEEALAREPTDVILFPADSDESDLGALLADVPAETRLLALIRTKDPVHMSEAANLPVHGFLMWSSLSLEGLTEALRKVTEGEVFAPPALVAQLLERYRKDQNRGPRLSTQALTKRERQVLSLMADGLANKEIARALGLSQHGVKGHVASILAKLNCANRTLAVVRALEEGLPVRGTNRVPANMLSGHASF